jgi:hypothetical protein
MDGPISFRIKMFGTASFSSRIAFISQYIKYELNKSKLGYFSTLLQENE